MINMSNIIIKNKRDTLENWTNNNPKLLDGELVSVIDENNNIKLKIGAQNKNFNDLNYVSTNASTKNKRNGNVDLSSESITLSFGHPTEIIEFSNNTAEVSISTYGEYIEASLNDNKITINFLKTTLENGSGKVIVNVAENADTFSCVKIINVTIDGVEFVTWADGTDEQIASMIAAAHDGKIKLTDYWASGDVRTVTNRNTSKITAETLDLVLYRNSSSSSNSYTNSSGNTDYYNFAILIDQKRSAAVYSTYTYYQYETDHYYGRLYYGSAYDVFNCISKSFSDLVFIRKADQGYDTLSDVKAIYGGGYLKFLKPNAQSTGDYASSTVYGKNLSSRDGCETVYYYIYDNNLRSYRSSAASAVGIISLLLI